MKRFALAAVVGSTRQVLGLVVAMPFFAGAGYLGSHLLNDPDHTHYISGHVDGCAARSGPFYYPSHNPSCVPPSRFVWQVPAAVLLGLAGLGALAVSGRRPRRDLPGEVSQAGFARI